ncbi:hypothetical protein DYB37_003418, partial [Aphanomyces astaci]
IPQHERAHQMPEIPGRSSFSVGVKSTEKVIECKVVTDDGMRMMYTSVGCMEGSSVHWMDRIPGQAACATGNLSFCAVGTTDGHLYIVSPLGRRLFPPIALGFPFAAIECSAGATPYLLVILTNGDVKTWTIQAKRVAVAASVCGLTDVSKRELLQTVVLPQMASNRVLQRLVHKYQLLLDEAANQS